CSIPFIIAETGNFCRGLRPAHSKCSILAQDARRKTGNNTMTEELQQISEHVWVYPHNPNDTQPNVGVIVTEQHTVLIDAGNSPRHARRILGELWRINAPTVTHVIYTHYHWDHTFGAQIFGGLVI